jgi:ElaB/YqjD/DUF883 family membrane-anchored ribosome-binding protein
VTAQATETEEQESTSRSRGRHNGPSSRRVTSLREQAGVVRDDVRDLARVAGDSAVQKLDPLQEYVREKPLRSLLIAAGVGAVFGMLFLRR